ncbi:hypothetical protein MJA45_01870 [Paenibacillus aurantius]|uniref:Uncharacterized protein n=1 Tax=Paenibacillus aurantius TaxID=2918900 RepID=A0AA96LDM2_9BACL|nr:hypothetical protein [Paenibacillus aurantius]WNQ11827.1 hypothetical protein MJA45_01870 [Paenibacillus aurantius]
MLTYEEKLAILDKFPELERHEVSLGRINYHYPGSAYDKKTVAYHLHPNGNGFVYAGRLQGYDVNDKGFVNIRDYEAEPLRQLIAESIRSLTGEPGESEAGDRRQNEAGNKEEYWTGSEGEQLRVFYEDELWYIYAGANLESACETYEEVEEYMAEEGFRRG